MTALKGDVEAAKVLIPEMASNQDLRLAGFVAIRHEPGKS